MWNINVNKNLGLDGYGGGFFGVAWDIAGPDICKVVQHFFKMGGYWSRLTQH